MCSSRHKYAELYATAYVTKTFGPSHEVLVYTVEPV